MKHLTDLRPWADYVAEGQRIKDRETGIRSEIAALLAEHDVAVDLHREQRDLAHLEGRPGPLAPEPPSTQAQREALRALMQQWQEHVQREPTILAACADDLETAYADAKTGLQRRTHRHLQALVADLADWRAWHVALRAVRRGVETANPNRRQIDGPSTRMRDHPSLSDLLVLVDDPKMDLCEPAPPPRPEGLVEEEFEEPFQSFRPSPSPRRFGR